ncbi:MAG: glycosyltransferase family 2 protein, partial [Asticcacaulis sp.]|nr:glycosyltransferase family 2 protein [Asticcacaulis sp.]
APSVQIDASEQYKPDWLLARAPLTDPASMGLYDRRPDDAVPLEGLEGERFLSAHGLLGDKADFAGAVAALNGKSVAALTEGKPDVSIVIPIYGQLAYTLNCLDSLLAHESKFSFEVILIDDVSPDASGDHLPKVRGLRYFRQPENGGFVVSCNTGAAYAKGRFVVFLNNDTRVCPGWLNELIDSFDRFPKAGLVGSKLFYPDGSLQEAGGIFWKDGSAWNYGRNDDPNRPEYCYAREVDYVSGAAIALPTELWSELGGFDDIFRPAYCEDADIAFRVRRAGFETWLQPLSRVIHYEGKTSGTDLTKGVKAYQVVNGVKFLDRWKETLLSHRPNGEEPLLERERSKTKRALVIDAVTPTPDQDAGSVTTVTTLKIYQELGYKVYFVPQDNFLFVPGYTQALQAMGVECVYAPFELSFKGFIARHGHLFDVIQVYRVDIAARVIDDIRRYAPQAKVAFHNMDMHFLRLERQAALEGDAKLLVKAEAVKQQELALIRKVDCTIVHSPVEEEMLA